MPRRATTFVSERGGSSISCSPSGNLIFGELSDTRTVSVVSLVLVTVKRSLLSLPVKVNDDAVTTIAPRIAAKSDSRRVTASSTWASVSAVDGNTSSVSDQRVMSGESTGSMLA